MKLGNTFKKLLLVILGFSMAFLGLELSLRYYFYRWNHNLSVPFLLFAASYPEHDSLRDFIQPSRSTGILFELKPNLSSTFLGKPFVTNSHGLVGAKEYDQAPPPDTIRIAGVGDSLMFNWGVEPEETCLSVLEEKLERAFAPLNVEILNFAVPGYNTAIEYEVIRQKVLSYHPHLIILGYCGNDMDLPNYIRKKVSAKSYAVFAMDAAIERIANTYRGDQKPYIASQYWAMSNIFATSPNGRTPYLVEEAPPEYQYMVGKENYLATMQNLAKLSAASGVPVIVQDPDIKFVSLLQGWGLETIPVYDALHTAMTLSEEDKHYNPEGHRFCAERLFAYLTEQSPILRDAADALVR